MALEGMVKTPFGEVKKKTAAIVGIGGGGILLIAWYRSKKQAQSATAASTQDQTSQDQNIDPTTGFPYGSPEDIAALQQMQYAGGQYGPVYGGGGGGNPGQPGPGSFTSNAEWSQYAQDYLTNTVGLSSSTVIAALGAYITGQPVTADQKSIINQAIAIAGLPPVSGTNGNPPGIVDAPGGGGGGNVTVPNIVGMETDAGMRALTAAGLVGKHPPLKPGVGSTITSETPAAGSSVASGTTVTVTIKEK